MGRYRRKPIEVEAWQVGSDEPMPEWLDYGLVQQLREDDWCVRGDGFYKFLLDEEFRNWYEEIPND